MDPITSHTVPFSLEIIFSLTQHCPGSIQIFVTVTFNNTVLSSRVPRTSCAPKTPKLRRKFGVSRAIESGSVIVIKKRAQRPCRKS